MDQEDFAKLRRNSLKFFSSEGRLMRKHLPAPQIVISKDTYQDKLLHRVHKELGHCGIEETYQRLVTCFWWPSLKKKVKLWVSLNALHKFTPCTPKVSAYGVHSKHCWSTDPCTPRSVECSSRDSKLIGVSHCTLQWPPKMMSAWMVHSHMFGVH
jgi:hypothetical protein